MERRPFTVAEVNDMIPRLEGVLARMREGLEELRESQGRLQVLDVIWGGRMAERGNPDHAEFLEHGRRARETAVRVEDLIRDEILERRIRFPQGGLEYGLLDFPTTYLGRWVLLCWQSGEPELVAWHEVDGGFAGRKPLTSEAARLMGSADGVGQ